MANRTRFHLNTVTGIERDCKYVDNFVNYIFNCWIWLFDFELNLTRPRLGLGLRASSTGIWLSGLAFWEIVFNIFLFKEDIKWQEHFYALYKTNIDCSLIGKLCKIIPLVDWRPWAYISLDFVSGNIVAHGLQSPRGVILHNFPHEQSIFVYNYLCSSIVSELPALSSD